MNGDKIPLLRTPGQEKNHTEKIRNVVKEN